jgi:hypothetical protein
VREDRDELIDRIVDELKVLPAVPADATARVLARVDAARRGQAPVAAVTDDDDIIFFPAATDEIQIVSAPVPATSVGAGRGGWRRRFVVSLPVAIGYALAATVAGFLIRGAMPRSGSEVATVTGQGTEAATDAGVPMTQVAGLTNRESQEAPVSVQFVLEAQRATRVALVGDFNAWDEASMPLVRDSVTGVWSTVVKVIPGRHVYAFVVDGEQWTLDPRAPKTRDADYGTEQSVIVVGLQ